MDDLGGKPTIFGNAHMKASMTDQLSGIQQTKEPQMSVLVMISQGSAA